MIKVARNPRRNPVFSFSDEARKRAEEHLKSVGYDFEKKPELIWPEGAVAAWQDHFYGPWKFRYMSDVLREKKQKMKHNLCKKREWGTTRIVPLYVWVFWCPGISGFFYRGWWLYLIGRGISSGKYLSRDKEMVNRIMELFPGDPLLFGKMDLNDWMQWFVKHYQRGKWCGKPQGKAPVYAKVEGDHIREILFRAEWPKKP